MARMAAGLMSYADLQRMPDDGRQYELYDGEVRVVPSPTNRHQMVLRNLVALFLEYAKEHGGRLLFAPSDVVFTPFNVIQPDLLYFSEARRHLVQLDTPTDMAPDLTIEVISPGTSAHDRGRKQAVCARFGVSEYWIIDPLEATIEIFVLDGRGYRLAQNCGLADGAPSALEAQAVASPTIAGLRVVASHIFDFS
jgi:Uma2 family endonuclease